MPSTRGQRQPKTFFLNETHELTRGEKPGGGGLPKYEGIAWAAKGKKISLSLRAAANAIAASSDPLKNERLFLIAEPVDTVKKRREDKQGKLRETYDEIPRYGAGQGRLFDRLGLDLIDVTEDGKALVHAEASRIEQLRERTAMLDNVGPLEQSRWATINSFETIPPQLRVDSDWLNTLSKDNPNNVVIELQPVLSRFEADRVLRAIADLLTKGNGGKLTATGSDFSGRYWFRGNATRNAVRGIARDFYSVQAIHSPLFSLAAAKKHSPSALRLNDPVEIGAMPDVNELPCVAVVDLGIPKDHRQLAHFRRGQFYPPDTPNAPVGDHASFVASRIVFGDHDSPDALLAAAGKCSIFDAMVAEYPAGPGNQMNLVNDKAVMAAMQGVKGAAPDVRVFNLSFGDTRHLENFNQIDKEQKRLDLQHLDNFVFATDSIVVVAAGNSQRGVVPNPAYPQNFNDPRWALGPWACGFNTMICGSFVSRLSAGGLVQTIGWPSPFTRVGHGLCAAPVPSFSAPGGNTNDTYNSTPGMGVWGLSGGGLAEDRCGTSHAAPILAREAALTISELQRFCLPGTQPFGVLVRAFLNLTATAPIDDPAVRELTNRTLGSGYAKVQRLITPQARSAVILWQGFIESPRDIVRIQLPVPLAWLRDAREPILRIVISSDPPVNQAARDLWACRRIFPVLHSNPDGRGIAPQRGAVHQTFPVIQRVYKFDRFKPNGETPADSDLWLLELRYEEIAPYPPGAEFDPRQRVAFAAELIDLDPQGVDPQAAIQDLPIAETMTRLSIQPTAIRSPIVIRRR